ncbi:MAG: hypothetical protein LBF97_00895 [Elusimicrobiota bacterium]|jgi:hypothetical protein|nr:hypothetical protein [Elusimicrobiota bacterium]
MEYIKTVNSILSKLTQQLPIVQKGDILETFKTVYHNKNNKIKNIIIEDVEMSVPISTSRAAKNLMKKDGSLLASIYNDMNSGDILKVVNINGTKLYCKNLSIKEEYRQEIVIDKLDILQENYKIIERQSKRLKTSLEKLNIL